MSSVSKDPNSMSRTVVFGFSSGIFFVLMTLVAVAFLNLPNAAGAAAAGSDACPIAEVSLDQGYGLSRTTFLPVCREVAGQVASGNTLTR